LIEDELLDSPIALSEILTALKKAKNKKSPGEDGITNEFITNLPISAIQVLQSIFNDILINRNWPDEWSHSDIKMIFKKKEIKRIRRTTDLLRWKTAHSSC
jgi:hypothetical protein